MHHAMTVLLYHNAWPEPAACAVRDAKYIYYVLIGRTNTVSGAEGRGGEIIRNDRKYNILCGENIVLYIHRGRNDARHNGRVTCNQLPVYCAGYVFLRS